MITSSVFFLFPSSFPFFPFSSLHDWKVGWDLEYGFAFFCSFLSMPVLIFEFNLVVYYYILVCIITKTQSWSGSGEGFLFPFFSFFLACLVVIMRFLL